MPIRLKTLELQGYKTFASRTEFEFSGGITAIVGPNGSGKSNIADALRWVLGEQSYGLLRAKKTEDMIFAGSESRTRAGMASATVLFDNSENWLPVDFSEVAMGRRAYRDGHNDYLLNGQQIRLREINELLAQSGLSERTYTILGQGLVDASLALKADERRRLFEEAAGVGLYRSRREETLRRLETTERNLERVLDIMAELEPRLRTLDRQARRARDYSRLQNDLRLVLLDWYGYHWHRAQQELAESREILHQQEDRQQHSREAFQTMQSEYASFRKRVVKLRSQLSDWYRETSELHSQRETISRELAILEERQRSLVKARQSLTMQHDRAVDEVATSRERLAEAETEVARVEEEYEEANTQLTAVQNAFETHQGEHQGIEGKLDRARSTLATLNSRRAESQARLDELKTRREVQGERLEMTAQAIQEASDEYERVRKAHRASLSDLKKNEKVLRISETDLSRKQVQADDLESNLRKVSDSLANSRADYSKLSAHLEVLDQAEQSLSGYSDGARYLLDTTRRPGLKGVQGVLSTSLEVPAKFETAIAAALGDHLDAVILAGKNLDEVLGLLESDEVGRAALLSLERLKQPASIKEPEDPECLGLASNLVSVPDELRPVLNVVLGQTLIVRNRKAAERLLQDQAENVKVVTLKGEVFRGDGLVIAGKSASGMILSRPRQRRELQDSLKDLKEKLDDLDQTFLSVESKLQVNRKELHKAEEALNASQEKFSLAQTAERQASVVLDSAERQLEWQNRKHEELQTEQSQVETEKEKNSKTQVDIDLQASQIAEEIQTLGKQLVGISLDDTQEQVSYWKTRAAVAEQSLTDAKTRREERHGTLIRFEEQCDDLNKRLSEISEQLDTLESERQASQDKERVLQGEIAKFQKKSTPAEEELASAEKQEYQLQGDEAESQRVMTMTDRQFNQVQVEVIRRQEALESLRTRIQDDFGLVMFEYAQDVSGPMPLPLDGMVEQLPVVKELPAGLDDQLARQRAQLRRIGPVNPEAQNEFEKESQRFEFLQSQVADLRKAESDLRQVIAELDDLTKQEFAKTFEAVDKEFRQIFVRLFGGGSARLELTDPENLVDSGIEIEARLPGRREQGLALLSGGERSLTAIALVFALLKVSPTPVCVMDEVDAMLDEANVGRFRELLYELSKETQFIIITHNRNTVQVADVIYGVTMGRDSASQIISLRLDEVTDEFIGN